MTLIWKIEEPLGRWCWSAEFVVDAPEYRNRGLSAHYCFRDI